MKQNHKLLLILGIINLFVGILSFYFRSILFIVPILLLSTFLFSEKIRKKKERLTWILIQIKIEIPKQEEGLCWILGRLVFKKVITIRENLFLHKILTQHRNQQINIPYNKGGYWWPIEDRQSRIDFIDEILKNIFNGRR